MQEPAIFRGNSIEISWNNDKGILSLSQDGAAAGFDRAALSHLLETVHGQHPQLEVKQDTTVTRDDGVFLVQFDPDSQLKTLTALDWVTGLEYDHQTIREMFNNQGETYHERTNEGALIGFRFSFEKDLHGRIVAKGDCCRSEQNSRGDIYTHYADVIAQADIIIEPADPSKRDALLAEL